MGGYLVFYLGGKGFLERRDAGIDKNFSRDIYHNWGGIALWGRFLSKKKGGGRNGFRGKQTFPHRGQDLSSNKKFPKKTFYFKGPVFMGELKA